MQAYFENDSFRIETDQKLGCVLLHWKSGKVSVPVYKSALMECLALAERFNLKYWVCDQREMGMYSMRNEAWTLDTFFPRLASTSIEKIMLVESEDEYNQELTRLIYTQKEARKVPVRVAADRAEALHWLASDQPSMLGVAS